MAEEWEIRPYAEGDEHGILKLFNSVFEAGNPDFQPRTLELWHWQFRDNPEGHHTFVAEADGEIVGTYTAIPARWRFPEGIGLGGQAVDTVVAPQFRRSLKRKGLFLSLAFEWFDRYGVPERDKIVYGFPNPQAFRIGTRRVDYRPVHCPMPESSLPVSVAASMEAPGLHVEEITEFGREFDVLDECLAPSRGLASVRDARYLNWRYKESRSARYRMLRVEGPTGDLRGFLVYTVGWHGDRKDILPLVDWSVAAGDRDAFRALIGAAARDGAAHGLQETLTWTPPNHAHSEDFGALGFSVQDSRFNLCIRIFTDTFDVPHAVANWYVLMGDSDIY